MQHIREKVAWATAGVLGLFVVVSVTGVVRGGPLDPPGSPASTQSNLVFQPASCAGFPIVIATSGSYRLASNITGCSGKDGIQIASSNVSLDLAGFTLAGVGGSLEAIKSVGANSQLSITNGIVSAWPTNAVDLTGSANSRLERLIVSYNGGDGVDLGSSSTAAHITATHNGGYGISAGSLETNMVISDCDADYNGFGGIRIAASGTVENCSVGNNPGGGIEAGRFATIKGNHVHHNNGTGVSVADSCQIEDNVSEWNNNGFGFLVLAPGNCSVTGNKATANSYSGYYLDAAGGYSLVDSNHASGNGHYGFEILAANPGYPNIVTKNAASANILGNYTSGANNDIGPIVSAASAANPMSNLSN